MFVKFCGFTREEDVEFALKLNSVNALGYIFHEKSKRYIMPGRAAELSKIISAHNQQNPRRNVLKVGVFVDQSAAETLKIAKEADLDVLQIYNADIAEELQKQYFIFFAARVKDETVLMNLPELAETSFYLLDAYNEKDAGGSGESFDWSVLKNFSEIGTTIIAGGISIENVKQALNIPGIYGVDLSSGIEEAPGIKSHEKMKKLDAAILEAIND